MKRSEAYHIAIFVFGMLACMVHASRAQAIDPGTSRPVPDSTYIEIAYGRQQAARNVAALSTVHGDELSTLFSTNLGNLLSGRLAGLTVMPQGYEPGLAAPRLLGRGIGTFAGGTAPLVMVDGFESNFEQLVPEEIETISLLKDAAATAVHGFRGANGVLLVTTKRGRHAPLQVQFDTKVGLGTPFHLPEFLGAAGYATLYNEALANEGRAARYTEAQLRAYRDGTDPFFHPDVDWYGQSLRSVAPINTHQLNFRGGNDVVHYFGLLSMMNEQTLLKRTEKLSDNTTNSGYRRYNFRTNIDVNLTKNLTAMLTLGGSVEDKRNPGASETSSLFGAMSVIPPNAFPVFNPDGSYGGNSLFSNPWGDMVEKGMYTSNGRTLQTSLRLRHKLDMVTPGLALSAAVSFNNFFRNFSIKSRTYERFALSQSAAGDTVYTRFGQNTSLQGSENESEQWRNVAVQGFANYDRDFGAHGIDIMLMGNYDSYTVSGDAYPYKHVGLGGRFNYAFNQTYLIDFSASYMGSENFAKGNRFGLFPAVGVGWVVSNEPFMQANRLFDRLKIRGSYGLVGNDVIGGNRFMFDQAYRYSSAYYFGTGNASISAIEEGQIANPGVTWEKEKKFNVGFDAALLGNALQLSADYFFNHRYHILASPNRTIPGFFGMDLPMLNVGEVHNRGVEAIVAYHGRHDRPFGYGIRFIANYANDRIVAMSEELREFGYQQTTGRRIGQPFGLEAIGFFRDEADIANSPLQTFTTVYPGDIKYRDQNNDGYIDDADYAPIGNPGSPTFWASLHPSFRYKGVDLQFLLHGVAGGSLYRSGLAYHAFQDNGTVARIAEGRWTPATADRATYPRLTATDNQNNYRYSSFWQEKSDFLKLRNVELGYTLSHLPEAVGIRSARVFANATNLFSWGTSGPEDPESNTTATAYPAMRTFLVGINIAF